MPYNTNYVSRAANKCGGYASKWKMIVTNM